jgi:hypothetical protein
MNVEASWRTIILLAGLSGSLVHNAFACRDGSPNAKGPEPRTDGRTFLIDLQLDKSGTVRAVQVWMGSGPLRSRAIEAASGRRYHHKQGLITVVVKFPQGRKRVPNVREAMPAGVSSCVPGGAPIVWPMIPWVNKLSSQPILPFLAPTSDFN